MKTVIALIAVVVLGFFGIASAVIPLTIEAQLAGKNAKEKADIKGAEIAKLNFTGEHVKKGIRIEIQSVSKIDGGVQVLARAWKGSKQLGFGKDGSVEIERFKIYNPPILVDDPNGEIVREWINSDTNELKQRRLREDPKEALIQSLSHTISLVGKENTTIIKDKVGNTTSTFYPAAGENAPVDGKINNDNGLGSSTFATLRNGATGTSVAMSEVEDDMSQVATSVDTAGQFRAVRRGVWGFNTVTIGTDTVDSAVLSFYGISTTVQLGNTDIEILGKDLLADPALLVVGDFDIADWEVVRFATGLSTASFAVGSYNDFTLNASGEAFINKTGYTFFGSMLKWDFDGSYTGGADINKNTRARVSFADETGTTQDPKLVVVHSGAVAASQESDVIFFD